MEQITGMTAELYKAIVAIVDERVREIRVTREDFDALRGVVSELAQAMERLAQAQARTEEALRQLAQQVGALSDNIGYGLEDIARVVLPGYLERRYKIKVVRLERRLFRVDGRVVDIDLYGEGSREGQPVVVLGEVKARIYGREVGQFLAQVSEVRPQVEGEVVPLMFGYFIDLSAAEVAGEDVLLVASYQPAVDMQSTDG